ncbi:MAG: beta-lactamase family protein [Chitinophagaceae bacterium]|jgi:CubicO group peptidase (beta-lactamase class C family)|nr:beta-lactamase family protein [Chitinophagaceae bacterium]
MKARKMPYLRKLGLQIIASLTMVGGLNAQSFDTAKLNRYFNRLDSNQRFMGSVAVFKQGKPVYQHATGWADLKNGMKADAHTRYRIGSITKTFTSVLVMKTVEAGKIRLDQTIEPWFPGVRNAQRITVRHLLTHRSGIHNITDNPGFMTRAIQPWTKERMLDTINAQISDFEPGTSFRYSNSGYILLTLMLEKIWNRPYEQLLKKWILKPARLKETIYGIKPDPTQNMALSYRMLFGNWVVQPMTDPSVPLGAGSMMSTPADICRFAEKLFKGKLIRAESLAEMTRWQENTGGGLFRFPFGTSWASGHTGGIDAYLSVYGHFQSEDISFAITSNATNMVLNDVTIALLSATFDKSYTIPDFSVVQLSDNELDRYVGVYVSKQVPMKLTITRKNGNLLCQATGQLPFTLAAHGEHRFSFDKAGIEIRFEPDEKRMRFQQGGGRYLFMRE